MTDKINAIKHRDTRVNIPTNELRGFMEADESAPTTMLDPRDSRAATASAPAIRCCSGTCPTPRVTRGKRLVVIVGQKKAMAIAVRGAQTRRR